MDPEVFEGEIEVDFGLRSKTGAHANNPATLDADGSSILDDPCRLSKFSGSPGLKLTLCVEVSPPGGVPRPRVEETKVALRELGLKDTFDDE